jgi:tetratricopeptide (TPR) repeat protein
MRLELGPFIAAALLSLLVAPARGDAFAGEGDAIARGDAAWQRRNAGARGSRAAPEPIGEAVAAYEEALARAPKNLEAYWKLLRAIHFQGDFTAADREERQRIFGRGREVSEQALDLLAGRVGGREALDEMTPAEIRAAFSEPEVARIYFWAAVDWGLWGQAFSKMAAARQGVAKRVRDYSRIVIALDPEYEDAGGYRIHARLHAEAPKIPLVTGWIDRDVALADIRRAVEIAPDDLYNRIFLADALRRFGEPEEKAEGLRRLEELAASEPRAADAVADTAAIELARQILSEAR